MASPDERVLWLLRWMTNPVKCSSGFLVAWNENIVDAFVQAFPEAQKALRYYMIGPNSCPMLNAAAKRAKDAGYITPGVIGNEGARDYNQRTWCRTWNVTPAGRAAAEKTP
jgi:hypothetical protein